MVENVKKINIRYNKVVLRAFLERLKSIELIKKIE